MEFGVEYSDINSQATLEAFLVTHPDEVDFSALNDLFDAWDAATRVAAAAKAARVFGASTFTFSSEADDSNPGYTIVDVEFRYPDGSTLSVMDDDEEKAALLPPDVGFEAALEDSDWGAPSLCIRGSTATLLFRAADPDQTMPSSLTHRQALERILGSSPFALAEAIDQQKELAANPRKGRRSRP